MEDPEAVTASLVDAGLLTGEQKKQVVGLQKEIGGTVAQIVVKLGYLDETRLVEHMAREHGMKVVDVAEMILPENLVKRVPKKLIEKFTVLPVAFRDGKLTIATANPYDIEAIEEIQMVVNSRVDVQLAKRGDILQAINEMFYGEGSGVNAEGDTRQTSPVRRLRAMLDALIPLLIEKGFITEEELALKARELGVGPKSEEPPPA
jgi:type IV pilus assembly protein PilB